MSIVTINYLLTYLIMSPLMIHVNISQFAHTYVRVA